MGADWTILEQWGVYRVGELYLGSDVVRSTTKGRGAILSKHVFLAHPKVGDLYVALTIQHHIV